MARQSRYDLYFYGQGLFVQVYSDNKLDVITSIIRDQRFRFSFMRLDHWSNSDGEFKLRSETVYLGGEKVKRFRDVVSSYDIEKLKATMTTLYRVDGTTLYFPDMPFTVNELREIFQLKEYEWYTMSAVDKDASVRRYLLFYDWAQKTITKKKVLNEHASELFRRELYGDVLLINENFIS